MSFFKKATLVELKEIIENELNQCDKTFESIVSVQVRCCPMTVHIEIAQIQCSKRLRLLEALKRIQNRTFGFCISCENKISLRLLRRFPTLQRCCSCCKN